MTTSTGNAMSADRLAEKVAHVKAAKQNRFHTCHWPGCEDQVPPAMWGCKGHWFAIPKRLRDRIWATYRRGQEITMTPSDEYLKAADDVQHWIREYLIARYSKVPLSKLDSVRLPRIGL